MRGFGIVLVTVLLIFGIYLGVTQGAFRTDEPQPIPSSKPGENDPVEPNQAIKGSTVIEIGGKKQTLSPKQVVLPRLTPQQSAFLTDYEKAVRAQDGVLLQTLLHPQSLTCLEKGGKDFLQFRIEEELGYHLPDDYQLTFAPLSRMEADALQQAREEWYENPVPGNTALIIRHGQGDYGEEMNYQLLAPVDGKPGSPLRLVLGCPTARTLDEFHRSQAEKQQTEGEAEKAVAAMKEPLKSRLLALITDRKFNDAVRLAEAEQQLSPSVAYRLVQLLERDGNASRGKDRR